MENTQCTMGILYIKANGIEITHYYQYIMIEIIIIIIF